MAIARIFFNDLRPLAFRPWLPWSHTPLHPLRVSPPLPTLEDALYHRRTPFSATSAGIFARPFGNERLWNSRWMDGVEIRDGGHEWVVESEMPGVKKGDLEVRVHEGGAEGGKVEVVGRVRKPQSGVEAEKNPEVEHPGESQKSSPSAKGEEGEGQLWRTEFKQTILLPKSMDKLDPGSIKAKLEDGVLTMRITKPPKRNEDTEGVRISVE